MRFYTNVFQIGNDILVRGYENGRHFSNREEFYPTFYVPSKSKKSGWKTLDGIDVEPVNPGTIRDCREFLDKYSSVQGFSVFGNERYVHQYISEKYPEDEIKFDANRIKLFTIDIEVAAESGFPDVFNCAEELLLITIQDYSTKQVITFGSRPYANTDRDNFKYVKCGSETELIMTFLDWWQSNTPEVITGWNCELYDIPYLVGRVERLMGEKTAKKFSPWGIVRKNDIVISGRKQISYQLAGISVIDYLDLYKKSPATPNQESYRLDHIANVELGARKLDHSEYDTFREFYTKAWDKFVDYNIVDVELVDKLEDKLKLIDLCFTRAYDAKVNFSDIAYQVRTWDAIIYNYLKKQKIVIPQKERNQKDEKYAGAYVKEPKPGVYDWVVSFDLNSLYPHLIMQYNISPETLLEQKHPSATVDKLLNQELTFDMYSDYAVCANGAMFRKDVKGFLPELMEKMYNERVIFKKRMLKAKQEYEKTKNPDLIKEIARCNNVQMAKKIALNSAYGAIGNQYFRYYKLANAEAITLSGQVSIRWIENKINQRMNKILKTEGVDYVIASDTDSIYLHMGPLVEAVYKGREKTTEGIVSFLNKICEVELEPYIDRSYQELANYVNAYDQKMQMKRENIADRGIWTAKKRYILNVWDSEGVRYNEPKLKIMGIEAIKTSTPAPCRKFLKDAFKLLMSGTEDEMIDYIEGCRKEFFSMPPQDIAFPRSVSDINKWKSSADMYNKGCPIHVRGAILYNYWTKQKQLDNKYQAIQSGEKIKFCYLKTPNPIRENVMSFIQDFPKELGLDKYIDYDLQFSKSFIEPIRVILDCIGWEIERKNTLESFFV
jgi:DNA polymerase elongation subunit (family B)